MARILVAEDQQHIRHVLGLWLGRNGHEVTETADGCQALRALRGGPFELLITDVNMPELDGVALARIALREFPTLRSVFVVTSRCDQQELLRGLNDPRVLIYPKPFSPSELLRRVDEALLRSVVPGGCA
jgi:CheY-like chemotaxis protein